ncbi:MAG: hypothetical protein QXR17_05385 [Candidatus Bathyarchaeia archaeon]
MPMRTTSGHCSGLKGCALAGIIFLASSGLPVSIPTSAPHQSCLCRIISDNLAKSPGFRATLAREQWLQLNPPEHFFTTASCSLMSFSSSGYVFLDP